MTEFYHNVHENEFNPDNCTLVAHAIWRMESSDIAMVSVMGGLLSIGGNWTARREGNSFMEYLSIAVGILLLGGLIAYFGFKFLPQNRKTVIALSPEGIYYKVSIFLRWFRFVSWDKIVSLEEQKKPMTFSYYGAGGKIESPFLRFTLKTGIAGKRYFDITGMNLSVDREDIIRAARAYIDAAHA